MKTPRFLAICLLLFTLVPAWGQSPPPPANKQSDLAYFDLDFPGGTPRDLVNAIQKATHHPLNAVIPDELANTRLPAVKMSNITVPDLFRAMYLASQKQESFITGSTSGPFGGGPTWSTYNATCGFTTADGRVTDDSIWYFHAEKPALSPLLAQKKECRFYNLSPYLDRGFSVDDITTAIQTGWKMQGDGPTPQISFHKETKLLIAVGEPDKLQTIEAVLNALINSGRSGKPKTSVPAPPKPQQDTKE